MTVQHSQITELLPLPFNIAGLNGNKCKRHTARLYSADVSMLTAVYYVKPSKFSVVACSLISTKHKTKTEMMRRSFLTQANRVLNQ